MAMGDTIGSYYENIGTYAKGVLGEKAVEKIANYVPDVAEITVQGVNLYYLAKPAAVYLAELTDSFFNQIPPSSPVGNVTKTVLQLAIAGVGLKRGLGFAKGLASRQ